MSCIFKSVSDLARIKIFYVIKAPSMQSFSPKLGVDLKKRKSVKERLILLGSLISTPVFGKKKNNCVKNCIKIAMCESSSTVLMLVGNKNLG